MAYYECTGGGGKLRIVVTFQSYLHYVGGGDGSVVSNHGPTTNVATYEYDISSGKLTYISGSTYSQNNRGNGCYGSATLNSVVVTKI